MHPLTLTFRARDTWKYFQKVELFFHYDGTGGRAGPDPAPNWFYYWSQICPVRAGRGNPGFSFKAGAKNEQHWESNGTAAGTKTQITLAPQESLSAFLGISRHEQTHEIDYWEVVWTGAGYVPGDDGDRGAAFDGLRDAWERTQPMRAGSGYGVWVFGIPASPPHPAVAGTMPAKDNDVAFETQKLVLPGNPLPMLITAWSDKRADVAAKDAVNARLDIDALDWSDLKVRAGVTHTFVDEDSPAEHGETANPTTKGNNKDY